MILLSDLLDHEFETKLASESLIPLRGIDPRIRIDETREQISSRSEYFCYARENVAEMLKKALKVLPIEYCFIVKEGYRPIEVQRSSFERAKEKYAKMHKGISENELIRLVSAYVAPPSVAGHPTGGAIDITLGKGDMELFMGTRFNDEAIETDNRTYFSAENIRDQDIENRRILGESLSSVGFVNYPTEWWHWSFGDMYWAYIKKESVWYDSIDRMDMKK